MTDIHIFPAAWKDVWWAAGRDFIYLPPVEPDFAALSLPRRILLRGLILPLSYKRRPYGWTARRGKSALGYLFARPRGKILMIEALGVVPEHRRQGIGRLLVERAAAAAEEDGLPFLAATVSPQNLPALEFSRSQGFRPWRARRWIADALPAVPSVKTALRVVELSPAETLPAYERWQTRAVKSGAAWAAEALLHKPWFHRAWKGYARHWLCYRGERESAYLRIAGVGGRYRAYLACQPADLSGEAPIRWLYAALAFYGTPFRQLTLELPTTAHEEAAESTLRTAGLREVAFSRLLLLRRA